MARSSPRLFGTDGVRGLANGDLTAELTLDLSVAAAHVLGEIGAFSRSRSEGHRPVAVVGRDTRVSGQFLEAAVVAGLASAGVDVRLLGVLPTPGVAHLTDALGADLGVMLSASHNPMPDNGVKFFARGGVKLDDTIEDAIEKRLREPWKRPVGADVGRVSTYDAAVGDYAAHLVSTVARPLDGIRVVLDCAHGAASVVGPLALREAGADVVAICAEPGRRQHQRRVRVDPSRGGAGGGARARRRRRVRGRRGRRPLPRRRRRRARWSTATSCWRSWRSRCATPAGCGRTPSWRP